MDPLIRAVYFNTVFQKEGVKEVRSDTPGLFILMDVNRKRYITKEANTFSVADGFANNMYGAFTICGNSFKIHRAISAYGGRLVVYDGAYMTTHLLGKNMFPTDSILTLNDGNQKRTVYTYEWDTTHELPLKVNIITIESATGEVVDNRELEYVIIDNEEGFSYDCLNDSTTLISFKK